MLLRAYSSPRMSFVRKAWHAYERVLHAQPIRTQAFTTGVLWTIGDVLAQQVEGKKEVDKRRTLYTALYASAVVGPLGHGWYYGLDRVVTHYARPGTGPFIGAKLALDTFLFTPVHVAAFFSFLTWVEGGTMQDIKAKLRQDYWPTVAAEIAIWPPYQALNFWKVPVQHQLLVCNLATVADSTFLCWARSQENWLQKVGAYLPADLAKYLIQEEPAKEALLLEEQSHDS